MSDTRFEVQFHEEFVTASFPQQGMSVPCRLPTQWGGSEMRLAEWATEVAHYVGRLAHLNGRRVGLDRQEERDLAVALIRGAMRDPRWGTVEVLEEKNSNSEAKKSCNGGLL